MLARPVGRSWMSNIGAADKSPHIFWEIQGCMVVIDFGYHASKMAGESKETVHGS